MTAFTANFAYTYPVTTDRPCDSALYLAQLAKDVDGDLGFLRDEFARFTAGPLAIVSTSTAQTLTTSQSNPSFTTVEVDTWNMVDLARDSRLIYIPDDVPGRYAIGGYVRVASIGGTNAAFQFNVRGTGTDRGSNADAGNTPLSVFAYHSWVTPSFIADPVYLQLFWTGTNVASTASVTEAVMWAYWVRDI